MNKTLVLTDMAGVVHTYEVNGSYKLPAFDTAFITFQTASGMDVAWSVLDISNIELK